MKTSQVFGGKCIELLANYDQELQSWRMLQMSFQWAGPMLLDRLPKSGMTVNGQLYALQTLEHHTEEQGGFVFAGIPKQSRTKEGLLPTPTKIGSEHRTQYSQGGRPLMHMIIKGMLPTPTATEHKYRLKGNSQASKNLEALARTGQLTGETGKDFQLNPRFVEEMMGFIIGWTELQP